MISANTTLMLRNRHMDLKTLTEKIELPGTVKDFVLAYTPDMEPRRFESLSMALHNPATREKGFEEVKSLLGDDPGGLKILSFLLLCALDSYKEYRKKGIGDEIFIDTMKYCTRTLNEFHRVHGRYGFDSAWWFPRQISLDLFRLGSLEYEMFVRDGEKMLSIHIPSDADMSRRGLRESWLRAQDFFGRFYPDYSGVIIFCNTWLLAPKLREFLPESSKIIGFQDGFTIKSVDKESRECMKWIFGREDLPLEELPENSSLQRKVKDLLLKGESVGEAYGILKDDPWCENPSVS